MDKHQLRKHFKERRAALSEEAIDTLSLEISNRSLELPIWDKTYYHIFLPISEKKEVNTEFLLHILQGRDKSVVVPIADFESGEMLHMLLQENTLIRTSAYGIPEPVSGIEIAPKQLEVVFVPLLGYDTKGNRIGYGKGFYDRFLAQCSSECVFVGLSFFEAVNSIAHEHADIPLHYCVTPEKIYSF
ncbi:5-formyltetrahydrofolate cyclo-ligase [Candidatus Ulvibacter alkanivorans]|jgi:5-formyltetrahydrofolate cyclo-ligase|uniref:5-formyltetrahydrofolate cyclo-ligase n=1 Tax=Candidatus Ulvibacter alkanivorans TaxID=2267620 RepID=UPI000DF30EA2|nr:5-formyltetrahydrofolate cyclo-ligase [Candidatus Ulvibacter alkanivorans]